MVSKLNQFGHKQPEKPQCSPALAQSIKFGQKVQKMTPIDTSTTLDKDSTERIQKVVGAFCIVCRSHGSNDGKNLELNSGQASRHYRRFE